MTIPIIIDTDPGQDDAVTFFVALASPEIELLGITTVAGNVSVAQTTRNALVALDLAGRPDIPVCIGADRPLVRGPVDASHVHGLTGFDGADLPPPSRPASDEHAVDFLIRMVMQAPSGTITICAIGPMTNLALAIRKEPEFRSRTRQIVAMIGAFSEVGNITPSAEFNSYVDPQAAAEVFASGIPLVMIPLDVTHQLQTSASRVSRIAALPNKIGPVVADWLRFEKRFEAEKYGTDGGPLHDPNTVLWLVNPELYDGRLVNVEIETHSELTMGMTVVDWWKVTERRPNALVLRNVDVDGVYDLLVERLGRLR